MKNSARLLEEWAALDLIRVQYSGFPASRIIPSESPDFILQSGRHYRIGIEITRLTREPNSTSLSSARTKRFTLQDISYAIKRKEEKRNLYLKKRLNELWLVLAIGLDASFNAKLPANMDNTGEIPLSGFNKVFLVDMKNRKVRIFKD